LDKAFAMILAGGRSRHLPVLTAYRSISALPYGGKYRVIDFCLSNCMNSGIRDVGVLAQYNPASLITHIGDGAPWDLSGRRHGLAILQPYRARRESDWYRGTADALWQNLRFLRRTDARHVLVLSGDHVYKMDYRPLIEFHDLSGAEATIVAKPTYGVVPRRYGALVIDERGIVRELVEKPDTPGFDYFSLGIYVFRREALIERLDVCKQKRYDLVFDVIMPLISEARVMAYHFEDFWADVGWLEEYYKSSMKLIEKPGHFSLSDPDWPVCTRAHVRRPSYVGKSASAESSLIAGGCRIEGTVRASLLFPGVIVEPGATVENSIVFSDSRVGEGATLRSVIVDKEVSVGRGCFIGYGSPTCSNSRFPESASFGVSLIGKRARIPAGVRIGRNCLIAPDLTEREIPRRDIVCGEVITGEKSWERILS
jgi:glucose-1-phosphate adenylyltransferase